MRSPKAKYDRQLTSAIDQTVQFPLESIEAMFGCRSAVVNVFDRFPQFKSVVCVKHRFGKHHMALTSINIASIKPVTSLYQTSPRSTLRVVQPRFDNTSSLNAASRNIAQFVITSINIAFTFAPISSARQINIASAKLTSPRPNIAQPNIAPTKDRV